MTRHEAFILALGDSGVVAALLGISTSRVSNWKHRGVPRDWLPKLAELAKQRKVKVPARFLEPEETSR